MVEKFIFNERLKRLEPKEIKCFFCREQNMDNINDCLFVPIYRPINKLNIIIYRSVKFNKLPVGVPRCKSCLEIHETSKKKAKIYSWSIALAICLFFCLFQPFGFVIGLMSIGFTVLILNDYIPGKLIQKKDIFTIKDAGELDESIQELIAAGWLLEAPRA
jgi:hypothetical protein